MRTPETARRRAEWTPKDDAEAAALHARETYIALTDALPRGRAALGHYARRVALMARGDLWPNAGDWDRLAAAGARDGVLAYYEAECERLRGQTVSDAPPCIRMLVQEHSEAVVATLDAGTDPDKHLARAIAEGMDLHRVAGAHVRGLMRRKFERIQARRAVPGGAV